MDNGNRKTFSSLSSYKLLYNHYKPVSHNRFYLTNEHISDGQHLRLRKHQKVKRNNLVEG